jgi:hypothetical protein
MEQRRNATGRLALAVLITLAGCSGSATTTDGKTGVDYKAVRAMAGMYHSYLAQHSNQAPKDEQAFRDYLQTQEENLTRAGLTVDKMFLSPRSGKPLKWVYGRPPTNSTTIGIMIVGYEADAENNQRVVIGLLGESMSIDEARFRAAFPNAK